MLMSFYKCIRQKAHKYYRADSRKQVDMAVMSDDSVNIADCEPIPRQTIIDQKSEPYGAHDYGT